MWSGRAGKCSRRPLRIATALPCIAGEEVVQKETFMAANEEFRVLRLGQGCMPVVGP